MNSRLEHALWLLMSFSIHRYLMSNAEGRWDGYEKATRHADLCCFYVAVVRGCETDEVRRRHEDDYQLVHRKTQELTDHLDEQIGFPLKGRPNYDTLAPVFFRRFIALADAALDQPSTVN